MVNRPTCEVSGCKNICRSKKPHPFREGRYYHPRCHRHEDWYIAYRVPASTWGGERRGKGMWHGPPALCHPDRPSQGLRRDPGLCSRCHAERYPRNDPDARRRARRDARVLAEYGITGYEYDEMLAASGGKCSICRRSSRLEVDHCHGSGRIRGLLCARCNTGLGQFKDNPALLARAVAYLADHGTALKLA